MRPSRGEDERGTRKLSGSFGVKDHVPWGGIGPDVTANPTNVTDTGFDVSFCQVIALSCERDQPVRLHALRR